METTVLTIERAEAEKLWRKYHEHRACSQPIDLEIERVYREIAKGKTIIRALDSIRAAGTGDDRLPKLAIARADATECYLDIYSTGAARMTDYVWVTGTSAASRLFEFAPGTFPLRQYHVRKRAVVPHMPPDIRPARGLANYHILWEAVWRPDPPRDPVLLRRIGKGDMWLVVGAWDLTEVERAAMADRIRPH